MNSHHLLRLSSMQFGLDDRIDEPLVPLPMPTPQRASAKKRWWRSVTAATVEPPVTKTEQPVRGGRP